MGTHKFRVGDRVEVLKVAEKVCYPHKHLGVNIVEYVEEILSTQVLYFVGHEYQCHGIHVRYIPTPLEELL